MTAKVRHRALSCSCRYNTALSRTSWTLTLALAWIGARVSCSGGICLNRPCKWIFPSLPRALQWSWAIWCSTRCSGTRRVCGTVSVCSSRVGSEWCASRWNRSDSRRRSPPVRCLVRRTVSHWRPTAHSKSDAGKHCILFD